jgi:serine/threonine protein phosphatase PrpC
MTDPSKLFFDFAAITDIGCERLNNEDSYGYDAELNLYVVCDGMGGRAAGEVASGMAVRTLIGSFASSAAKGDEGEPTPVADRLMQAILDANHAVREAAAQNPNLLSMGTTLVCACLDGGRAVFGNVGDSRAYLIRDGHCLQVTQDHSLLAEALRAGEISLAAAATSNLQSMITRAIGAEDAVDPDLYGAELQLGDILLLASDGLTRYVQPDEIENIVRAGEDLTASCQEFIDIAKSRGGVDNITCILLRVIAKPGEVPSPEGNETQRHSSTPPDEMEAFTPII